MAPGSFEAPFRSAIPIPAENGSTDRVRPVAVEKKVSNALSNGLLASLPHDDFKSIQNHLQAISCEQGHLLIEAGDEVEHVYFPHDGTVSLLRVMKDGRAIETSSIGREGAVGAMAGLGLHTARVRAVVQMPLTLSQISAAQFRKAVAASITLRDTCLRANEILLAQTQIIAGCNALHSIEARFCRWMLQVRELSLNDIIPLTQEFLAEMFGVQRTSISEAAQKLQTAGLIRYRRGKIEILDHASIQALACECHESIVRARSELQATRR